MSEPQKTFNDKLKKHLHVTFFVVYYEHLTSSLATFSSQIDESDTGSDWNSGDGIIDRSDGRIIITHLITIHLISTMRRNLLEKDDQIYYDLFDHQIE